MDRASGSVSETCWSGAAATIGSSAWNVCICSRKRRDLVLQTDGLGLSHLALLAVGRLQRRHVALDAGLDLLHPLLQLGLGEVLVAGVHRLELAAVDRRHRHG